MMLGAIHGLGMLYKDQGKLGEAETMYQRALQGKEKALGAEHTSTLSTLNNLGLLYADQRKLGEAEKMYQRALQGKKALGAEYTSSLSTANNLGRLYANQGKLGEAEKMYQRALQGYEKTLGLEVVTTYVPALNTSWGLGSLFQRQGHSAKARILCSKALVGYMKVVGHDHPHCQSLRKNLSTLGTEAENKLLVDTEEDPEHNRKGQTPHLMIEETLPYSKRDRLLRKLGFW
jgi:tetratricopeptide (TPR) repeat protein